MPYEPLLNKQELQEIKVLYMNGMPKCAIARKYRVSWGVIHYYLTKYKWIKN